MSSLLHAYNDSQRLTSVTEGGTTLGQYTYDALGRRTKKVAGETTTLYIYDQSGLLIAEYSGDGVWQKDYVYLNGQPLTMIVANTPENVYYYHNDHLGTPQVMTDSTGTVVWAATYDPFGKATINVEQITNNLLFPGQYFNAETGLHYNWNRYYDPKTGRYVEADPIGINGGINLWPYGANNPINRIDPMGLYWEYSQSTGQLTYVDNQTGVRTPVATGYSGNGLGLNNPAMQNEPNVGPIPQGTWAVGPQQTNIINSGTPNQVTLPAFMRLTPDPGTNTFNRGGFIIHGDNPARNRTASEGCPVFDRPTRNQIGNSGDTIWRVVP